MFGNCYQGGDVFVIFSGQGKDPVAKWRLFGGPSAIRKEFDKEVKGFVYCLEGCSQTVKMQMPTDTKMSLGLLRRFLVLQVNVALGEDFSIELMITDSDHMKRRLLISTVQKELSFSPLHAKIPIAGLERNIWSSLCIDLVSFTEKLYKGFSTLDVITLCATCKVRRIFSMKTDPSGMSYEDLMHLIPSSCHFPPQVNHVTLVLNVEDLQKADMWISDTRVPGQLTSARTPTYQRARPHSVSHTASGSKVSGPSLQTGKNTSTVSDGVYRRVVPISNMGSSASKVSQKVAAQSQRIASLHGETCRNHLEDECSNSPDEESSGAAPTTAEPREPRRQHEAPPEDDIIGSESNEGEDGQTPRPADPSGYNLNVFSGLRIHGDEEEELRMLAILQRPLEGDDCVASGLSASQIHKCNVSISMSSDESDDTSTWTMPANQGHHYQSEMSPLLQSNPREWMDVLSPPINPPGQMRRSDRTRNNPDNLVGGGHEKVNEGGNDDMYLDLIYDPDLNNYLDPKTGTYFELA